MRRLAIIAAALAILVSGAYYVLLLKPKLDDVADAKRLTEQAREEEQTLRNRIRALEQARRNAPETTAQLNALRLLMPSTPDLPGFIRQVQDAADGSGVDLRSIQPSRPSAAKEATGIDTLSVNIAVEGGFRRVEDFVVRLENLKRIVEVRTISLAPAAQEIPGQITLSATFTLRLYVVQENARFGATVSARPRPSPSPGGAR